MARPQYSRKIENTVLTVCWVVSLMVFLVNVVVAS